MEDYSRLSPHWWDLEPNARRTLRQEELFRDWRDTYKAKGYILAVTGMGKTRIGEMAIAKLFETDPNRIVNIVVPHKAAKRVWLEVKERSPIKRIRIIMAHVYLKRPADVRKCDLLIVDECHHFSNEETKLFGRLIDATNNHWILCLSATLGQAKRDFLHKRGIKCVGEVTMKEARECNYIAEHYITIVDVPFSKEDTVKYNEIDKEFHTAWKKFGYEMPIIFQCLAGGDIGRAARQDIAEMYKMENQAVYGLATKAMKVMNERKVFLRKAPSKLYVAQLIAEKFPNSNILTFGEFTDVADQLTTIFGEGDEALAFHSNLGSVTRKVIKTKEWKTEKAARRFYEKNKGVLRDLRIGFGKRVWSCSWLTLKNVGKATLKQEAIERFEDPNDPLRILNTAKALDEAADIENVDVAIILSYTSNTRQLIQRIGRTIRFKKGKVAYVFILCMTKKGGRTQEQKWLNEAVENLDTYERISALDLNDVL